ncbi:hypothetical protein KTO58_24580 [Chitinophaga pendula]|uniref:hypothetical protein n=1 Tax=Chitinophaga TaxID=79328 RepID=UPI000BAFC797|nr:MULTISPECIES: hypothetical protein [Chitinophaga]ASZ10234.1 hypothetical protein CK934_04185 [Chitinophaga sp. MD30]UCJ06807.1 hypothetical protein KTO58_24580 [Chitinophaga pendula]
MRIVTIIAAAIILFACNQSRSKGPDTSAYDVVAEKSYVIRNIKPVAGDSLVDAIRAKQQQLIAFLEKHQFVRHVAAKDSLVFRRSNGQEVLIELPVPEDAWSANTIIAFDPAKNPLFINLHKDSTQIEHYLKQADKR